VLTTVNCCSDIQPVIQVVLKITKGCIAVGEDPVMSLSKQVIEAGSCAQTKWEEYVQEGAPEPLETHVLPIIGVYRDVAKSSLKISLVQKGTRANRTDTINGLPDGIIYKCPEFLRNGVIDRMTARPREMVDAASLCGVFFRN
jgi:hypothetical protein